MPVMKALSPAAIVWMKASYDMLFTKRLKPNDHSLRDLMVPRSTGDENNPAPIPEGERPWDET